MQEFLVTEQVKWKFNLSRAPWLVGLTKQGFYKATGKAELTKEELKEVILDT